MAIQVKATEQYFPVTLSLLLFKFALTFESENLNTLKYAEHLN